MNTVVEVNCLELAGFRALPASRAKKHPMGAWGKFRNQEPSPDELSALAQGADAVCMLMGSCSGNAETLDFDNLEYWEKWRSAMRPELLARLLIEVTQNGGHHVIYRCSEIEGNQKLAMERWAVEGPGEWPTGYGNKKIKAVQRGEEWVIEPCLIETRGEGGLIICSPSPGYTFEQGDPLTSDITVAVEERAYMLALARSLSKVEVTERPAAAIKGRAPDFTNSPYPRDQYNQTAELDELLELLADGDWTACGENSSGRLEFTRPGKDEGAGGTLTKDAPHIFYNFSENAGLPVRVGLPPFDLLVAYGHGGDLDAALADLKGRGFEFIMPEALGVISEGVDVSGVAPAPVPLIDQLNARFAVVPVGGRYVVLEEHGSKVEFRRKQCLELALMNEPKVPYVAGYKADGEEIIKYKTQAVWWLEHPDRREYDDVVFRPGGAGPREFNMWRGFAVEPDFEDSAEKCKLYRWHIENIVCGGNPITIKYFWGWAADLFQQPGRKPGVCVALLGTKGTGKGMAVEGLLRLLGRHGFQTNDKKQVVGQFNGEMADKILVFLDEVWWSGDKGVVSLMKGLITEKKIKIERKGVDAVTMDSFHRYIMASNDFDGAPAGEDERRFLILDVLSDKMKEPEYWRALVHERDHGGDQALLGWLLKHDYSDVDLRQAPKTQGLANQALANLDDVGKWVEHVLHRGHMDLPDFSDNNMEHVWPFGISRMDDVWEAFESFRAKKGLFPNASREEFKKRVFGPEGYFPKERDKKKRIFRRVNGKGAMYWPIPNLETCRKRFESKVSGSCSWDEVDDLDLAVAEFAEMDL